MTKGTSTSLIILSDKQMQSKCIIGAKNNNIL